MSTPPQKDDEQQEPQKPQQQPQNKKQQPEEDGKNNKVDKLVMGAIIGVAVGSVVGMSMKNKSGSPEEDTKKHKEPIHPKSRIGKALGSFFFPEKKKKPALNKNMKKIPSETE